MLFNRSRVAVFLGFLFMFMAAIFIFADARIENEIDLLDDNLLSLQASMASWVAEAYQDSAQVFERQIKEQDARFIEQQFELLSALMANALTTEAQDETLLLSFSEGKFGMIREDGIQLYQGTLPEAVITEAYQRLQGHTLGKNSEKVILSDFELAMEDPRTYEVYFYRNEKYNGVLFTGEAVTPSAVLETASGSLDAYFEALHEARGYESYLLNSRGRIVSAFEDGLSGDLFSLTDQAGGTSVYQKVVEAPNQRFSVLLSQPYEVFSRPVGAGHLILMKPAQVSRDRTGRLIVYALIAFNLALVTGVLLLLRKNHAFVIEKISLTELQVKRRKKAASFIVIVIVLAFSLMILLVHGLLNIQLTQRDFDHELQRFSDAMAEQYSEAYTSLDQQYELYQTALSEDHQRRLIALYRGLRSIPQDQMRFYPSTISSSAYVVNWMRLTQTARDLVASQYAVDLSEMEDYLILQSPRGGGWLLVGYDVQKASLWILQSMKEDVEAPTQFVQPPLEREREGLNGFFAHYTAVGAGHMPVLEKVVPDQAANRALAEGIGVQLGQGLEEMTIGIQRPNDKTWIVYVPDSSPIGGDLKQAAYDFTKVMGFATLLLTLIVGAGWRYYGGKEPVS